MDQAATEPEQQLVGFAVFFILADRIVNGRNNKESD